MASNLIGSFLYGNLTQLAAQRIRNKAILSKYWQNFDACKVLLVTEDNPISKSQIFPFYYYARKFQKCWNTEFREINIIALLEKNLYPDYKGANLVFIQPWFTRNPDSIVSLITILREKNPDAKIVFLDSYAPLDLRLASTVSPVVDWYVKKHIFCNRSNYEQATRGDTNLVDYYNGLYNLPELPLTQFDIPSGFMDKLIVGPSFFTSQEMLPIFACSPKQIFLKKTLNIHARLGVKGSGWYQHMREHALKTCEEFKKDSVVTSKYASKYNYFLELMASRICFSPFGYGEVCWRDYEAIMCGALLIKPDMSHIETSPNIFIPEQTYVPVAWDFSDLTDKLHYYLENKNARQQVTQQAYYKLHDYANSQAFLDQFSIFFKHKN